MEDTSYECGCSWGSVRKVRYLADIKSSIDYILEYKGKKFENEILRQYLLLGRQKRLELIHKHFQSVLYTPLGRASLQTKSLQITMPDTITFLKNMGLLQIESGCVKMSPLAEQLRGIVDDSKQKMLMVRTLLESKYLAYWCLLILLQKRGTIKIPKKLSGRGAELRNELHLQYINTDVASLYTMRDLYYELETINWYVDSEGDETIYSTVEIAENGKQSKEWQHSFPVRGSKLFYRRSVSNDLFVESLVNSYLEQTGERFDAETSLISVRDGVCRHLRISDQQFKELLEKAKVLEKNFAIRLSYGSMYAKKRNYGLKIASLPLVTSERLALYIRIKRSESNG